MSEVWKTKYGPRRVRRDPPTVTEAVAAARGLTDDVQEQIEIAASLMDMPPDQVRPEVLKTASRMTPTPLPLSGAPARRARSWWNACPAADRWPVRLS